MSYNYSLSSDFHITDPTIHLNVADFMEFVRNNSSIDEEFYRVDIVGDVVTLIFSDTLDEGEITALNTMITNYSPCIPFLVNNPDLPGTPVAAAGIVKMYNGYFQLTPGGLLNPLSTIIMVTQQNSTPYGSNNNTYSILFSSQTTFTIVSSSTDDQSYVMWVIIKL